MPTGFKRFSKYSLRPSTSNETYSCCPRTLSRLLHAARYRDFGSGRKAGLSFGGHFADRQAGVRPDLAGRSIRFVFPFSVFSSTSDWPRKFVIEKKQMQILSRKTIGQTVLITIEIPSIETRSAAQISRRVTEAMRGGNRVIVDLGALRYFDVGGFAAILNWAAGGSQKADVRFCSQSGTIRALFELLRAHAVVPLYRNREEAMASFHRPERRSAEVMALREEESLLPGQRIA